MYVLFILSLIGLCAASLMAFIVSYRKNPLLLAATVPMIALCGSLCYFSYQSVIGYPMQTQWKNLPDKITVIFFRVVGKETISIWLLEEDDNTRVIDLPYMEQAEDGLEGGRKKMGQGIPATFERPGKGEGKPGEGKPGEGEPGGEPGEGKDDKDRKGWRYKIKSYGDGFPGGSLPPK